MVRAALIAMTLLWAGPAALAEPAAEALVVQTAETLSQPNAPETVFVDAIDVERVARFTLGKHARRVDEPETARYTEAFEGFLMDAFAEHRDKFISADVEVTGSIDRSPSDSIVKTLINHPETGELAVNWRVIERGGEWRVVDVSVEGLWLAIEQRAQIASILGQPRATIDDAIAALNG